MKKARIIKVEKCFNEDVMLCQYAYIPYAFAIPKCALTAEKIEDGTIPESCPLEVYEKW